MELIEIIRTALLIFAVASSVFILLAYGVYKYKDRMRVKPYLKNENLVSPVVLLRGNEVSVEKDIQHKKQIYSRFQILNQNPIIVKNAAENLQNLPVHKLRQKPVISYYSFNKKETMHKLHSSKLAD